MGNESFSEFLDSLKQAGVIISNEPELRERLSEAQRWRYAFQTLAANGKAIGIAFAAAAGLNWSAIERIFDTFRFSDRSRSLFAKSLQTC